MKNILCLVTVIFTLQLQAQKVVMLQKPGGQQQAFYGNQPFIDAYSTAANGDTIYLPGGAFISPNTIDKRLTVYGAGHYPDSTNATGKTIIANTITIGPNADSLHMEGIEFGGDISIGGNVNYLLLKRNSIQTVSYDYLPVSYNNRIEGNVIKGNINLVNAANSLFVNNIIAGQLIYAKNGEVARNNVFLTTSNSYPLNSCTYALFENNIFLCSYTNLFAPYGCDYNTFNNNVFVMSPSWLLNTNNNNYINADAAGLFVNQSGFVFSYTHNYHLQSPGSFLGVDATQCGVYGGLFIYKEGAVPATPHIRQKTIANTTDATGKLNVNITVGAQNN
ncbi:MAG: hypothetical protein IPP72_14825 [Chitinophagaceae bacterium]|nr:hypothetical protein [Chitinophagaceae bacterium]